MNERVNEWSFERRGDGWIWRLHEPRSQTPRVSPQIFLTLLECIQDAKLHGYGPEIHGSRHPVKSH